MITTRAMALSFLLLTLGGVPAVAQMHGGQAGDQMGGRQGMPCPMMGGGGMMGQGGMMGGPHMSHGMMLMMFALSDANGDGALDLEEFQTAHKRLFAYADKDDDGKLTPEDMQSFMKGMRSAD